MLFGVASSQVPYLDSERANTRKFGSYLKFAFVRNASDRLLSTYLFLQNGGTNDADAAWAKQNLSGIPTFESFVESWLSPENIQTWVHFRPQH